MSGNGPGFADDEESSSSETHSSTAQTQPGRSGTGQRQVRALRGGGHTSSQPREQHGSSGHRVPGVTGRGSKTPTGHPPSILPPEKVFPVQIGSELFRLSGASISSDAPSYFTQFFEEQIRQNEQSGGVRTLYIDRDPETFRDVARHLQGKGGLHSYRTTTHPARLLCQASRRWSLCEIICRRSILQSYV